MTTEKINYDNLLKEYKNVCSELETLKTEYQENTIVQSMNDMKKIYHDQKKVIDKLYNTIDKIHDNNKAIKIMLNALSHLKKLDNTNKYELKIKIEFIQEILNENFQLKHELYYLDCPI